MILRAVAIGPLLSVAIGANLVLSMDATGAHGYSTARQVRFSVERIKEGSHLVIGCVPASNRGEPDISLLLRGSTTDDVFVTSALSIEKAANRHWIFELFLDAHWLSESRNRLTITISTPISDRQVRVQEFDVAGLLRIAEQQKLIREPGTTSQMGCGGATPFEADSTRTLDVQHM